MPSVSSLLAVLLLTGSSVLAGPIVGRDNAIQCLFVDTTGMLQFTQAQAASWLAGTETAPEVFLQDDFQQALRDCCAGTGSSRVASAKAPTEKADANVAKPKQATNRIGGPNEKADASVAKPKQATNRIGGPSEKADADVSKPKQATNRIGGPSEKADADVSKAKHATNRIGGGSNEKADANVKKPSKAAVPDPKAPSLSDKSSGDARVSKPTDQASTNANPLSGLNVGIPISEAADAVVAGSPQRASVPDPKAPKEQADITIADLSNPVAVPTEPTTEQDSAAVGDSATQASVPKPAGTTERTGEKADTKVSKPAVSASKPKNRIGVPKEQAGAAAKDGAVPKPAAGAPTTEKANADVSEQHQPSEASRVSAPTDKTSEQAAAGSPLQLGQGLGLGGNGVKEGVIDDNGKCTCPV